MITITIAAADKIKEIAEEEGFENKNLRVKVVGGGCAGFSYDLAFVDDDSLPMDEEFEAFGVKIIIDPLSYQYLIGSEIDFVSRNFQSGFKFINPNITSKCGCGSSFGV